MTGKNGEGHLLSRMRIGCHKKIREIQFDCPVYHKHSCKILIFQQILKVLISIESWHYD